MKPPSNECVRMVKVRSKGSAEAGVRRATICGIACAEHNCVTQVSSTSLSIASETRSAAFFKAAERVRVREHTRDCRSTRWFDSTTNESLPSAESKPSPPDRMPAVFEEHYDTGAAPAFTLMPHRKAVRTDKVPCSTRRERYRRSAQQSSSHTLALRQWHSCFWVGCMIEQPQVSGRSPGRGSTSNEP